jgi:hypothetical protein
VRRAALLYSTATWATAICVTVAEFKDLIQWKDVLWSLNFSNSENRSLAENGENRRMHYFLAAPAKGRG